MCTKGSVGQVTADTIDRYIDRYVGRYSVDTRPMYQPSGDRHIGRWYIGQQLVVYRSTVGGILV